MQVGDKRGDISGKSGAGGNKRATAISIAVFAWYLKLFISLPLNLLNKH